MSSNRYIFTVGDYPGTQESALKLAQIFYPDTIHDVVDMSADDCFVKVKKEHLQKMVFLGHGNTQAYGEYTADEFVSRFAAAFNKHFSMKDKIEVHDLYLIGCDIGLIRSDDGISLAQEIANALQDKGFNCRVHSIAKPEKASGESLMVDVLRRVGARHLGIPDVQPGYIDAYLMTKKDSDHLFDLLQEYQKNHSEIEKMQKTKAFYLLKGANPVAELEKPHNIFLPHEKPHARRARICKHPYTQLSNDQKMAIELLTRRRDYEYKKNAKSLGDTLDFIITQLGRVQPDLWQQTLENFIPYLTVKILGLTLNDRSHTLQLLKHICDCQFDAANKIIFDQELKSAEMDQKQAKKRHHPSPLAKLKSRLASNTTGYTRLTDNQSHDSDDDNSILDNSMITPATKIVPLKEKLLTTAMKMAIDELVQELNTEIAELSKQCFFYLHYYEFKTKVTKRNTLLNLYDLDDLQAMVESARRTLGEDGRDMRSYRTTRTRDLIFKIGYHADTFLENEAPQLNIGFNKKQNQ